MSFIRITKQFSFETGHALYGYDGKCKNVHGHSYKLSVTVIGKPIADKNNVKYGMVIDFSDLKQIVKEDIVNVFDHATVFAVLSISSFMSVACRVSSGAGSTSTGVCSRASPESPSGAVSRAASSTSSTLGRSKSTR